MAGRGAWRLDGGARRVETIAPSSPPPVVLGRRPTLPCNAPTLPFATVPVGAALETPAASNLRVPTRPMARAPVGNAKTHSTPSHYDGVEHKWWLPSPPPPPLPPPWASSRRPRHHIRRRLRRATRCVGAFAAAPAQHGISHRGRHAQHVFNDATQQDMHSARLHLAAKACHALQLRGKERSHASQLKGKERSHGTEQTCNEYGYSRAFVEGRHNQCRTRR